MKLLESILFIFFLFGCSSTLSPQENQCFALCSRLENSCHVSNSDDFEFDLCYDYCINLPSEEEVDSFQGCGECYIAIECNYEIYAAICYPHCESAPL